MSPWKFASLPRCATWMFSVAGLLIFLVGNLALPRSQASAPLPAQEVNLPANFSQALVVSGISNPTTMDFAPDGRLFVCQQNGNLRVIKDDILLATPFLTVTVSSAGERGLIGLTFDPNFAVNRFIYVYYTATSPNIHNRISRFTANGDVVVPGSEQVLVDLPATTNTNHNGGALHFGPDGKLYIAVGEDGVPSRAQDLANPFGKILRINADGTIPTDNPFFNSTTGISR
ncbi:MAG TPA: PQQ-dependent sugar dehydrogenase, partial [Acidobacteriota bacterium]|nr:PQQ-dependent sugar dehydrogenase [Acidobacteriota bacterium]